MSQRPWLVTGASGFVGRALVSELAQRGVPVLAMARREVPGCPEHVEMVSGLDLTRVTWGGAERDALRRASIVIHTAGRAHVTRELGQNSLPLFREANRDATLRLAGAAAREGVARFVFVSSIGVHGSRSTQPFRHDDVPAPHGPYALAKLEAERGLMEISARTGLEVVIVRPPLVLGQQAPGNLGAIAKAIRAGFPLPLGGITRNRRDLVSRPVLVDLLIRAAIHPAAAGQIFLASDGHSRSTREIVEAVGALEGLTPRLLPVPPKLLELGLRGAGKAAMAEQLLGDLEVDIGFTCAQLEWVPAPPWESEP